MEGPDFRGRAALSWKGRTFVEGPSCQARPELSGKARAVKQGSVGSIFDRCLSLFSSTWDRYGINLGSIRGHFALVRYQFRLISYLSRFQVSTDFQDLLNTHLNMICVGRFAS